MSPFEKMKTLHFTFNNETIEWQLQLLSCFSFVRCNHPFFIDRFGHPNIILTEFKLLFDDILQYDEDYIFFEALQQSVRDYSLADLKD